MSVHTWSAQPNGRYVLDALIGAIPIRLMIDTGLVDPSGQVALELSPALFDQIEAAGELSDFRLRFR